ncbi:unnamed protein product [Chrysodeixis includens]|uniref:Uncharacterized protein n=1 Tax=Chrysodeixis includens TaxID=689277 RepID=A0A9N8KTA0_CHRIL|nr:unnamed protein product [Chrysodeixis includens]
MKKTKSIFDLRADDIIASEIGDIYEQRRLLNTIKDFPVDDNPTKFIKNKRYKANMRKFFRRPGNRNISTTERTRLATPSLMERAIVNRTVRDIRRKMLMRQLDKILNSDYKYMPNFNIEEDHFAALTKQGDELLKQHRERKNQTRREVYWSGDVSWSIWLQKKRILDIMSQFVYMTRYKLIYSQVLRNKYGANYRYKLGYLFALVRHIKNMQKWVYTALKKQSYWVDTINFNMKCYERIMRFDIDIKNLVQLIIKTEYLRNMEYSPRFYDYSLEKETNA